VFVQRLLKSRVYFTSQNAIGIIWSFSPAELYAFFALFPSLPSILQPTPFADRNLVTPTPRSHSAGSPVSNCISVCVGFYAPKRREEGDSAAAALLMRGVERGAKGIGAGEEEEECQQRRQTTVVATARRPRREREINWWSPSQSATCPLSAFFVFSTDSNWGFAVASAAGRDQNSLALRCWGLWLLFLLLLLLWLLCHSRDLSSP
jgi:hypothetical protein